MAFLDLLKDRHTAEQEQPAEELPGTGRASESDRQAADKHSFTDVGGWEC